METSVNSESNALAIYNYCVYIHTSPSNKRYVGVTRQLPEKRWKNGYGYITNRYFWRAIKKYGWENFTHQIVVSGLTQNQALHMEIDLIEKYDSFHNGYNMSLGGEGLPGRPFSGEARERCIIARSHPINQYSIDGHFIATYKSIAEAARITGIEAANISNCARKAREHTSGYLWAYQGKSPIIPNPLPSCYAYGKEKCLGHRIPLVDDFHSKTTQKLWKTKTTSITQYDVNFNKIADWESLLSAEKATGCSSTGISLCVRGKAQTCGGFYWSYKGQPIKHIELKNKSPIRTIFQYDKETKHHIGTYKSLSEAESKTKVSSSLISGSCCRGRSAGGYYWMYEDNQYDISTKIAGKKVRCIDTGEIFDNARIASEKLDISPKAISKCCNKSLNKTHGLRFEFVA